jgi:flagellar hook protein FlgE
MGNYITYIDHAQMLFNPYVEGEFRYGKGWSYGIEAMARKTEGRFFGSLSYSWSRTLIQNSDINNGKIFPARQDRPHNFNVNLNYNLKPRWSITANWVYSTGSPITTPTGYYYYNGYQVPFYDKRNNDRLPNYHRLDLATSIKLKTRGDKYSHSLNISLFNAYGRANPFGINFNKIIDESGALVVPTNHTSAPNLQSSMVYIFGAIPSVTYHFSF